MRSSQSTTTLPGRRFRRDRGSAALRFLEFFTVNIRHRNTRAAYARAAAAFLRWCEGQAIDVQRVHVAVYIRPTHEASYAHEPGPPPHATEAGAPGSLGVSCFRFDALRLLPGCFY
jgi:hypothetical protein